MKTQEERKKGNADIHKAKTVHADDHEVKTGNMWEILKTTKHRLEKRGKC